MTYVVFFCSLIFFPTSSRLHQVVVHFFCVSMVTRKCSAVEKSLSHYHLLLYWAKVWQRRLFRYLLWYAGCRKHSTMLQPDERLPHRYKKQTSKLIRRLDQSDI